jgi:hypothetical protein
VALIDEFREFLGSLKTSEAVSPELRRRISVETGLEGALESALRAGRDVVIAGSAGGGKTHLLENLRDASRPGMPPLVPWTSEPEPKRGPFVRVVADATAVAPDARQRMFADRSANCRAIAVAINEGPLLGLAHALPDSHFAAVVAFLHSAQRGVMPAAESGLPVVLDVGGYDPIGNGVVARLLGLSLLAEIVQKLPCQCEDERICPRRLAWKLIDFEDVRKRVNEVLRVVNLQGQAVLFRELWDFVADLVTGGSCQDDPPTSPWFWRVFYGSSALSKRLQAVADPSLIVFPRAEAHMWYGDWQSPEIPVLDGVEFVPLASARPFKPEAYRWLKSQLFFLARFPSILDVVRDQVNLQLTKAMEAGRTPEIIAAINSYMTYGIRAASQQVLTLWADMGVERHMDRARGQVSLGDIHTTEFELRRSIVVVNHPDPSAALSGARVFLVHPKTGASFALSQEVLSLLRGGRSYRSSDRPHTDLEWHLSRFFSQLGASIKRADRLEVMEFEFEAMAGQARSYRMSVELKQIEPIEA